MNSPDFSDIQFVVQGQTFYAHKVILCARSPYFRALFLSGMKESALEKVTLPSYIQITVDDFAATSYYLLLLFIYTDALPPGVSPQDSMELLMLANQYSLDGLKAAVAASVCPNIRLSSIRRNIWMSATAFGFTRLPLCTIVRSCSSCVRPSSQHTGR